MNSQFDRRTLLRTGALASISWRGMRADERPVKFPPTRAITRGPRKHWFGYYDKLQFDPTSRYVLGMEVEFEHRSPTGDDVVRVGMVDLQDNDRWIELGKSRAWCWQQGCMLQWVPGAKSQVIWNDRQGDSFVSRIMDVETRQLRTVASPVYTVSPNGREAMTADFRRIQDVRPGYGYAGLADPHADDLAPRDSGVFHVDLTTGRSRLVVSLADIARLGEIPNQQLGIKHYFNHLLFSPEGSRFIALHRWRYPNGTRLSRMITARPDGSDLRVVIPNGYVSHFIWRDEKHIFSQSRHYCGNDNWGDFLFEDVDGGGEVEEIGRGVLDGNGHISYLPGNEWILNDTYPQGKERVQTPHLYHVKSKRRVDLGRFHLPPVYRGEWRVDTHPRFSPDGKLVCIDAPDGHTGRQLFLIDIRQIVG
jgi:hypothetical protein